MTIAWWSIIIYHQSENWWFYMGFRVLVVNNIRNFSEQTHPLSFISSKLIMQGPLWICPHLSFNNSSISLLHARAVLGVSSEGGVWNVPCWSEPLKHNQFVWQPFVINCINPPWIPLWLFCMLNTHTNYCVKVCVSLRERMHMTAGLVVLVLHKVNAHPWSHSCSETWQEH